MRVVSTLEEARTALREADASHQVAHSRAAHSRSPLAGEPNPSSDLVGGLKPDAQTSGKVGQEVTPYQNAQEHFGSPARGEREHVGSAKSDLQYDEVLRGYARQMRKAPTPWEMKLWNLLKGEQVAPYKFRRQVPIDHYIADFVNYEKRLIIELDGSQHADSSYDPKRDAYLRAQGFNILRFWNNELDANPSGILERIAEALEKTPHRNAKTRFLGLEKLVHSVPIYSRSKPAAGGEWEREAQSVHPIELCSPPFAACHAGVNYYRALVAQLRAEFPATDFTFTLCCGDDPAIAHDALRLGFTQVVCDCGEGQFAELSAIATAQGATLMRAILDDAADAAKPIAKFA